MGSRKRAAGFVEKMEAIRVYLLSPTLRIAQIGQHLLEERRALVGMHLAVGCFVQVLLFARLPHYVGVKFEPLLLDFTSRLH